MQNKKVFEKVSRDVVVAGLERSASRCRGKKRPAKGLYVAILLAVLTIIILLVL